MTVNTNPYCLVDISQPDPKPVLQGPQRLPQNWQDPDGFWHFNLNNPVTHPNSSLIALGWYPYVENDPGAPAQYPQYYTKTLSDFVVNTNVSVTRDVTYVQWSIDQLKDAKIIELEVNIPVYDGSQLISNPDRQLEVQDITVWVANSVIDLDDLEVWEDVAGFDTVLPDPLPLDNTYLGERQSRQGVELYSEDSARVTSSGGQSRSGPATNAWLDGCFAAKDDITGSTPVPDPPAEVRQDVNNPNEFHATAQLIRREWDAPDSGHGVRIKIRPRPGQWRTMVARIYDELESFMYELSFVEAKPGLWAAETPAIYRTPVAETIHAELGYGSASPFTKRLRVPASVQKVTRKIRYNR